MRLRVNKSAIIAIWSAVHPWLVPLVLFAGSLAAYSNTFTRNYTYDAAAYATQIRNFSETGRVGWLFHPHHLLYNPLGLMAWYLLTELGLKADPMYSLQYMNAFFGALGLVLLYEVLQRGGFRLTRTSENTRRPGGILPFTASIVLGCAYGYWVCATDGRVTMPGLVGIILVLGLAWGMVEAASLVQCLMLAGATVLAIGLHQSHGILMLAAVGSILLGQIPLSKRASFALIYLSITGIGIAVMYLGVGVFIKGFSSYTELKAWILAYAQDGRWWDFNILNNLLGDVSALVHAFISPDVELYRLISNSISVIFALGVFLPVILSTSHAFLIQTEPSRNVSLYVRRSIILALIALPYAAFFTVWTPGYFVFWMPVAIVLIVWIAESAVGWNPRAQMLFAALWMICTIGILYTNLSTSILPRTQSNTNPDLVFCEAFAKYAKPGDLILITGTYAGSSTPLPYAEVYIPYFTRVSVRSMSVELKRENGDVAEVIRSIRGIMRNRIRSGHKVFILDEFRSDATWSDLTERYRGVRNMDERILSGYSLKPIENINAFITYELVESSSLINQTL